MTDMGDATRADILTAFGVTETDLAALDPTGSYEQARRDARAEHEFWRRMLTGIRHCSRCGYTVGGWYGHRPGQHAVIQHAGNGIDVQRHDDIDSDTIRFTASQQVRIVNCIDQPVAAPPCTDIYHRWRPGERTCLCGIVTWKQVDGAVEVTFTVDDDHVIIGSIPLDPFDRFDGFGS